MPSPPHGMTDPVEVSPPSVGGDGPASHASVSLPDAEGWVDDRVRERLWWAAGVLFRRRWWIVGGAFLVAVAVAGVSLTLPNEYRAETRLLLPESSGIGGLLESVVPGASAILGGEGGGYTRYLAILTSRTTLDAVVERFDLVDRYDIEAETTERARAKAIGELEERSSFEVSLDYEYLAIRIYDEDPQVASQMANFFVAELNRRHIELTSGSAAANRQFLETRLQETEADLDSTLAAFQSFQEQYGVIELESQAGAFMEALAQAQGAAAESEAQYRALRNQFGDENPEVAIAREVYATAREQVGRLTGGSEAVMPVPLERLPTVTRGFARLQADLLIHEEVLKVIRPLYEQAVLTERQEADAVQVIDRAIPPSKKARPRRSLLVLFGGATAVLFFSLITLLSAWVRTQGGSVVRRLQASA